MEFPLCPGKDGGSSLLLQGEHGYRLSEERILRISGQNLRKN